jgi:hypothetical protein
MLKKRWKIKLLHCIEKAINNMTENSDYADKIDTIVDFNNNTLRDLYSKDWYTHLSDEKIDMDHTV